LVVAIGLIAGLVTVPGTTGGLALPANAASSWSFVSSPNPVGAEQSSLNSVVCLATTNCVAVGDSFYIDATGVLAYPHTLVERWDGNRWSIEASPSPPKFDYLASVSCTAPGFCVAVGYDTHGTLVEQWNGSKWSVVPSPNKSHALGLLTAVSCRTSKDCVAVGSYDGGYGGYTLIEHWDGTRWSVVPSPNSTYRHPDSELFGVSCTTGTACVAVGDVNTAGLPLVEQWNGSKWSIVPSVHPAGSVASSLQAVKCTSNTTCVAVGTVEQHSGYIGSTLVERWDGKQWSIVPSPSPTVDSELSAVKCVTVSDCVAVGGPSPYSRMNPQVSPVGRSFPDDASPFIGSFPPAGHRLIEHWNGRTWSIVASPGPSPASNSELFGVSCATRAECMAVGGFVHISARVGPEKTLVEHYSSYANGFPAEACNMMNDAARAASAVFYANNGGTYPKNFGDMENGNPRLLELPNGVTGTGTVLTGNDWKLTMTGGGKFIPTFTCSVDS